MTKNFDLRKRSDKNISISLKDKIPMKENNVEFEISSKIKKDYEDKIYDLHEKIKKISEDNNSASSTLEILQRKIFDYEKEINQLKVDNKKLAKSHQQLKTLREQFGDIKDIGKLKDKYDNLERNYEKLKLHNQNALVEVNNYNIEERAQKELIEIMELNDANIELVGNIQILSSENKDLVKKVELLGNSCFEKDELNARIVEELQDIKSKYLNLKLEFDDQANLSRVSANLLEEIEKRDLEIGKMQDEIEVLEATILQYRSNLLAKDKEIDYLTNQIKSS